MGKTVIVPDISYSITNLGKAHFLENTNDNVFKITALESLTISFPKDLLYNNGKSLYWKLYKANSILTLSNNETIGFKANLIPDEDNGIGTFNVSGRFIVSGSLNALVNNEPIRNYAFKYLFKNCIKLISAENLSLPRNTTNNCYEGMFKGCTLLTTSPVLCAPILSTDCYKEMFYGCSSLNEITIFSQTQIGEYYSKNWVYGVSNSGLIIQIPNINYIENGVDGIPSGWTLDKYYNSCYFTIKSLENNNTVTITNEGCLITPTIEYSVDNGITWNSITSTYGIHIIDTININEYIIFRGINDSFGTAYNQNNRFNCSKSYKVYGNIMSLFYGDMFGINSEFKENTTFNLCGLFYDSITLTDASDLILPALYCTDSCYNCMFRNCSNLSVGPELPATQSEHDCYSSMFEGCINLEEAPEINLVNMSQTCCARMFCMNRNSKITTPKMTKAPILKVAICANGCYNEMFKGNGNLVEVTCLKTDNIDCCNGWLANCSTSGTFIKSHQKDNWVRNTSGIPENWTITDYIENE